MYVTYLSAFIIKQCKLSLSPYEPRLMHFCLFTILLKTHEAMLRQTNACLKALAEFVRICLTVFETSDYPKYHAQEFAPSDQDYATSNRYKMLQSISRELFYPVFQLQVAMVIRHKCCS